MRKGLYALLAVLAAAAIAFAVWWRLTPHTAAEQLDAAAARANDYRERAPDLDAQAREALYAEVVEAHRAVKARFPDEANREVHEQALIALAEFEEATRKDLKAAVALYEEFLERYEKSARRVEARWRAADLKERGEDLDGALAAWRAYLAEFPESPRADEARYRIARLLARRKGTPPAQVLDAWKELYEKHKSSKYAPEALWERGKIFEQVEESEAAIAEYQRLVEEYPDSEFAARAQKRLGVIYGEKLNKQEEAKEAFAKLERDYGGTPEGRGAGQLKAKAEDKKSQQDESEYFKQHYGRPGADQFWDKKPIAPTESWSELLEQKLDFERYELTLAIDPQAHALRGLARFRLTNGGAEKRSLVLVLDEAFAVEAATVAGKPCEVTQGDQLLRMKLAEPLAAGAAADVEVRYAGAPKKENLGLKLDESGFGLGAAGYFPFTMVGDVFEARTILRVPVGYEAVGMGGLESATEDGTEVVRQYRSATPVFAPYFAYGKYRIDRARMGERDLLCYSKNPGFTPRQAQEYLATAREILSFYEARFGSFPFEKLAIVECDLPPVIGGVGPASLMFVNSEGMKEPGVPRNLLAHELAHQWWGNLVPVAFSEGYSPWLSEGFATYSDALFLEAKEGRARFVQHLTKYGHLYFDRVLHLPDEPLGRCYGSSPIYRAVVYEKGACVLHALRGLVGDDAFFKTLREYALRFRLKPSTPADFRAVAEDVSRRDLKGFFEDWLDREGYPHLAIVEVVARPTPPGAGIGAAPGQTIDFGVAVAVEHRTGVYRQPLSIAFTAADGRVERREAAVDEKSKRLEFALPFEPVRVEIDPEAWVMKHPGDDHVWTRELQAARARKGGGGAIGKPAPRSEAAGVDGTPVALEALRGRVVIVDFWATWCGPCQKEIPGFVRLSATYGASGLEVVGLSREPAELQKAFAAKAGIGYRLGVSTEAIEADWGGVRGLPTTFLVDRSGVVRARHEGFEPYEAFDREVRKLLDEPAPVPADAGAAKEPSSDGPVRKP